LIQIKARNVMNLTVCGREYTGHGRADLGWASAGL